jgi:hypothetical protein
MMVELVALKAKRPKNLKTGQVLTPRVFGYGSSTGYNNRWKTICKRAGIPYLSAHRAGRHGFYTELVVRQGSIPSRRPRHGGGQTPHYRCEFTPMQRQTRLQSGRGFVQTMCR